MFTKMVVDNKQWSDGGTLSLVQSVLSRTMCLDSLPKLGSFLQNLNVQINTEQCLLSEYSPSGSLAKALSVILNVSCLLLLKLTIRST